MRGGVLRGVASRRVIACGGYEAEPCRHTELGRSYLPNDKVPWPLFTIDFEASGLGEFTYPIEIGIAAWRAPNLPVETWSSLISPPMAWGQHRIWSREGEAVHGISREELAGGISPLEALTRSEAHTSELQSLMRISY